MKVFISTSIATIILLTGVTTYIFHLMKTTQLFSEKVDAVYIASDNEDWKLCYKLINDIEQTWSSNKAVLCAFTDHEELDEIEKTLSDLKEFVLQEDKKEIKRFASMLQILFKKLKENELPIWENILGQTPYHTNMHRML